MTDAAPSSPSEPAPIEMHGEASPIPELVGFPPYPPYAVDPAPPSVAETIIAGRDLRVQQKSVLPRKPVRPLPKPARPRGPKATDVKLTKRAARAHARCLRRHNAVLTDRLEYMSKPAKRAIICLWRQYADILPADTIARLRSMLDADEPFKPDQAYEYFVNMKKTKKRTAALRGVNQINKDLLAMCEDKRFLWARNATVAFARGIQQRLSRPGRYALADGMLRLSNIILDEICGYTRMRTPSRRCKHPKAKFMMEMSDKVAVWIDEILSESDDRMLMMDFDEDEGDLAGAVRFADDFLNMMGGKGGDRQFEKPPTVFDFVSNLYGNMNFHTKIDFEDGELLRKPTSAYLNFSGEMLEAFKVLTDAMYKKGNDPLISYGKCNQSYREAADELKQAPDFQATDFNTTLAEQLNKDLTAAAKADTPKNLEPYMKDMVDICGNYLAQHAEYNKDKGPAFNFLTKQMKAKGNALLYQKGKLRKVYNKAAQDLEQAKGLETNHDDPNLSQEIHAALSQTVKNTPEALKDEMKDTLDICSKYLSEKAIDEIERGPAFDLLIRELKEDGAADFTPEHKSLATKFATAYTLQSAPGLSNITPDPKTVPRFTEALHRAVDPATPKNLKSNMNEVIDRCAKYLSAFVRDRDKALQSLLTMMKSKPTKELAKRNNYSMDYATGAHEIETARVLVPFLPVKDISDEIKGRLTTDMEKLTPPALGNAMKSLINDVSGHLSQPVALRSGAAGERYPLNFLSAAKKSLGTRSLFKYKTYGQTYSDAADVLKYAGPLDTDHEHHDLHAEIHTEMTRGVSSRLAPTITAGLKDTMHDASKHLAKMGVEKGNAMDYLVDLMHTKGEAPLEVLQGYQQSYNDGARRLTISPTLANDKVEKGAYESVREKLTTLTTEKPTTVHEKHLPGLIDDSSKFLASPLPESDKEKRQVLADLMARKGDEILGQKGIYKMTYQEAGPEIMKAPVGVAVAKDAKMLKETKEKMKSVIPDKKMEQLLKEPVNEGSAYVADVINGRGEALQVIHDNMKKEGSKELLNVGKFSKTHEQGAEMLANADHFGGQHPSPVLYDKVSEKVDAIPKTGASSEAQKHMTEASNITSAYIAGVATKESGLGPQALAAMDDVGWDASADAAGKARARTGSKGAAGLGSGAEATGVPGTSGAGVPGTSGAGAVGTGVGNEKIDGAVSDAESRKREEAERKRSEKEEREKAEREKTEREKAEREKEKREKEERNKTRDGRLSSKGIDGGAISDELGLDSEDPERRAALGILHKQLRDKGDEILYQQPHTELTHAEASQWLSKKPRMKVDKSIKESADTGRLYKKFERKLGALVSKKTPASMQDTMQDVVIESSRVLSECFVSKNYKAHVEDALISEMQKKDNEILVDVDGSAESYFFAAQRLKKAKKVEAKEPCHQVSYFLSKKLDDMIRCRSMPRKLAVSMKDHVHDAADYLSEHVTKPDEQIAAYVALLREMEATGDALLVEGDIPKSYKDAAAYLHQLTTFEDQIRRGNSNLQSSIETKLRNIMRNVPPRGYSAAALDGVIRDSTRLLVSYILLQVEKTEVLKELTKKLKEAGEQVLLRHGPIRKTHGDGAEILCGKNADQLSVLTADPVVSRKIQIKLYNLMQGRTPDKYEALMDDVIEDATMYLAVYLLEPRVINVCKCMKNVFVQCELWCDDILRRVARPCCTCSRHEPARPPSGSPPAQVSFSPCPAHSTSPPRDPHTCPARRPTSFCNRPFTQSYFQYSTLYNRRPFSAGATASHVNYPPPSATPMSPSFHSPDYDAEISSDAQFLSHQRSYLRSPPCPDSHSDLDPSRPSSPLPVLCDSPRDPVNLTMGYMTCSASSDFTQSSLVTPRYLLSLDARATVDVHTADTLSLQLGEAEPFDGSQCESKAAPSKLVPPYPPLLRAADALESNATSNLAIPNPPPPSEADALESYSTTSKLAPPNPPPPSEADVSDVHVAGSPALCSRKGRTCFYSSHTDTNMMKTSSTHSTHNPTISTDQMCDWHAMMISLMWNVQAWRDWIQENVDRALSYQGQPDVSIAEGDEDWERFQRRVATEALQWRQYNVFSRQLTLRLAMRYRDKQIVSPTRATNKTNTYMDCQQEMLRIIEMFSRWTQWLTTVVKEANSLTQDTVGSEQPMHELRWMFLKRKVLAFVKDWDKYNMHLRMCWQHKYGKLISEWLPAWKQPGPVWVMSACGAVPSGAVAAGVYDSELVWVARTTHRCNVLPAALHPSKHCCIVYADGAVHHYTKYQVMCNADARWVPWRAGAGLDAGAGAGVRAVRAAAGVHVGRVLYRSSHLVGAVHAPHYRCHVVIFGRPFAFNCYELLVVPNDD